MTDITDKMATAYWEAYREGYYEAGGKLDYPHWAESNDPVKNETYRCMRFAADVLMTELISILNDPATTNVGEAINGMFPLPPMTRTELNAVMVENNKKMIDVMRDAAAQLPS